MSVRPSRSNLLHIGVMVAVLIGSLAIVGVSAGGLGSVGGSAGSPAASDRGEKADKAGKTTSVDVTVTGTLGSRTASDGSTEYTLTSGDTVLLLDAGPAWFYKDTYPLEPYVGKQVTITGEQSVGSTSIDVLTVDGTALREPGKPPWAGGWKVVGKDHPGWSQEKADRHAAKQVDKMKRFGLDCWPPGHCKDGSAGDVSPGATSAP